MAKQNKANQHYLRVCACVCRGGGGACLEKMKLVHLHLLCFGVEPFPAAFDVPFYPTMDPSINRLLCVCEATVGGLFWALRLALIDEASVP